MATSYDALFKNHTVRQVRESAEAKDRELLTRLDEASERFYAALYEYVASKPSDLLRLPDPGEIKAVRVAHGMKYESGTDEVPTLDLSLLLLGEGWK